MASCVRAKTNLHKHVLYVQAFFECPIFFFLRNGVFHQFFATRLFNAQPYYLLMGLLGGPSVECNGKKAEAFLQYSIDAAFLACCIDQMIFSFRHHWWGRRHWRCQKERRRTNSWWEHFWWKKNWRTQKPRLTKFLAPKREKYAISSAFHFICISSHLISFLSFRSQMKWKWFSHESHWKTRLLLKWDNRRKWRLLGTKGSVVPQSTGKLSCHLRTCKLCFRDRFLFIIAIVSLDLGFSNFNWPYVVHSWGHGNWTAVMSGAEWRPGFQHWPIEFLLFEKWGEGG